MGSVITCLQAYLQTAAYELGIKQRRNRVRRRVPYQRAVRPVSPASSRGSASSAFKPVQLPPEQVGETLWRT